MARFHSDYLVIGGGLAGLSFALRVAARGDVVVVVKGPLAQANTSHAQGGIASVWSPKDSFESHTSDTISAGVGLNDRTAVEAMVQAAPERIRDLVAWGVRFSQAADFGEHSYIRDGHTAGIWRPYLFAR